MHLMMINGNQITFNDDSDYYLLMPNQTITKLSLQLDTN